MDQSLKKIEAILRLQARRIEQLAQNRRAQSCQVEQLSASLARAHCAEAHCMAELRACEQRLHALSDSSRSFKATDVVAYLQVLDTLRQHAEASLRERCQAQALHAQAQQALASIDQALQRARTQQDQQQRLLNDLQHAEQRQADDRQDDDSEETAVARLRSTASCGC